MAKGEYPIEVDLTVPGDKAPSLTLKQTPKTGIATLLDAGSFDNLPAPRGLLGRYYHDPEGKGAPFLEEWDPVLNFTNGNDFSAPPYGSVRWSGALTVDKPGTYVVFSSPANLAKIKIDGKALGEGNRQGVALKKGPHAIEVFVGDAGNYGSFSLAWVKPDGTTQVVPNSAFGEVH